MKTTFLLGAIFLPAIFGLPVSPPSKQELDAGQKEPGVVRDKRQGGGPEDEPSSAPIPSSGVKPNAEDTSKVTWVIEQSDGPEAKGTLVDLQGSGSSSDKEEKSGGTGATDPPTAAAPSGGQDLTKAPAQAPAESVVFDDSKDDGGELRETVVVYDGQDSDKNGNQEPGNTKMDTYVNKCVRVRCTPPPPAPPGLECKEVKDDKLILQLQLEGLVSDCCPVHKCKREDASTYFHYGVEIDDETSPVEPYKPAKPVTNDLPAPPPRPASLPPFISGILPPIFPFMPQPSNFYNMNSGSNSGSSPHHRGGHQQQPSSSSSQNNLPLPNFVFPSLSSGSFRPVPSSSSSGGSPNSFQVVLPSQSSKNNYPASNGGDSLSFQNFDRMIRNTPNGGGGSMSPFGFSAMGPQGTVGGGPMNDGIMRSKRNPGHSGQPFPARAHRQAAHGRSSHYSHNH